ncbi:MAG: hypothetical protein HQL18_00395 [Candidatus Omnitrophica bacterium]|nr:hypothetical protein [Candidatus Omnitrophota bacterium]
MSKSKKKVAAAKKVATKGPAKIGVAKKALKKVSYGAGLLVRKVRKAGKVVQPKLWKDAGKSIKAKLDGIKGKLARKIKSLAGQKRVVNAVKPAPVSQVKSASPARSKSKKATAKRSVRKVAKKAEVVTSETVAPVVAAVVQAQMT